MANIYFFMTNVVNSNSSASMNIVIAYIYIFPFRSYNNLNVVLAGGDILKTDI